MFSFPVNQHLAVENFTYQEINQQIITRSNYLIEQGLQKDDYLLVSCSHSFDILITFWACLQVGIVYVPCYDYHHHYRYKYTDDGVVVQEAPRHEGRKDLAYLITTSGTTGIPKKVRVPRQTLYNNIISIKKRLNVKPCSTFVQVSPPTFDPSIIEMTLAFFTNSRLILVRDSPRSDWSKLIQQATILLCTPSLYKSLNVKVPIVVLGGEAFPIEFLDDDIEMWNIYGTTETSVWASLTRVTHVPSIHDFFVDYKIIDNELWIGGEGRETFVNDEVSPPLLRPTGDIVQKEGEFIFFVGRTDDQIKRMGQITYPSVIQKKFYHPLIKQKQVVADKDLLLLFCCGPPVDFSSTLASLPFWMRPDDIIFLNEFPLTKHGKLDIKKLDCVEWTREKLTKLLGGGDNDYFMQVGGNSLRANAIVQRLKVPHLLSILLLQPLGVFVDAVLGDTVLPQVPTVSHGSLECNIKWTIGMEKCVDASPCIYNDIIYIGSHSGYFIACDRRGTILWSRHLPNRIEATAICVDDMVCVGCYDGIFYGLDRFTGDVVKTFTTCDIIKCRAHFDGEWIWFGSYDHYIYALDIDFNCKFKYHVAASTFASPTSSNGLVYICTFKQVLAISRQGIEWQVDSQPIFSSPVVSNLQLIYGCVDGHVYSLDKRNGHLLWKCELGQEPIYSSPLLLPQMIVIGSFDRGTCFLDLNGRLIHYSIGQVYATPTACQTKESLQVASIDIQGTLTIYTVQDTIYNTTTVTLSPPGTTFASPLYFHGGILLPSREDALTYFI